MRATLVVPQVAVTRRITVVRPVALSTMGVQGPGGPLINDLQVTLAIVGGEATIDVTLPKKTCDLHVTEDVVLRATGGAADYDGKPFMVRVVVDPGMTVSFGSEFRFGQLFGPTDIAWVEDGESVTYFGVVYRHAAGVYDAVSYNPGFGS